MISRAAKIQVIVFVLASVVGVAFVGARYVGLGDRLLGRSYTVNAELPSTGGLFSGAPVTYRGVPVGRVADLAIVGDGVRAHLRIDRGVEVPVDLTAVVAQRSAVGEQYLDLRPDTDAGPYLRDGDTIPRERTRTPLPMETFLAGLDALVRSIGVENLQIVIDELGQAFEGNEEALRRLLDANSDLLAEAQRRLPEALALIRDTRTVLATQAASADAIRRWATSLARLAAAVRSADPDLRRLLAAGRPAAAETIRLLHGLDPAIGTLVGNLVVTGDIAVRRLPGLEQILVTFPLDVAGGFTVVPGDGTAHLGLVVNINDPAACNYTVSGTQDCTAAERASGSGLRGSANAPRAGGPQPGANGGQSTSGSGPPPTAGAAPGTGTRAAPPGTVPPGPAFVAGFDPATGIVLGPDGLPLQFGGTGGQYRLAGDQSWKQLLLAGLAP